MVFNALVIQGESRGTNLLFSFGMKFDIMFNNEICNLVYLQDASNDIMDVNSEELMNQTDYSDTNIEHLITNSSSFIVSITNFFHRKFKNSLSLEV